MTNEGWTPVTTLQEVPLGIAKTLDNLGLVPPANEYAAMTYQEHHADHERMIRNSADERTVEEAFLGLLFVLFILIVSHHWHARPILLFLFLVSLIAFV